MDRETLLKLIQEDEEGLLTVKPRISAQASADERLVEGFAEINSFVREQKREPEANKKDIKEMQLYSRLLALRADPEKALTLRAFDEFNLLAEVVKPVETLADVFADDDLGLLDDEAEKIFDLKHVPSKSVSSVTDYVAKRRVCADFDKFEHLFQQCQRELSSGIRTLMPFSRGTQIKKGDFYVLKGVVVYVADERQREGPYDPQQDKMNDRLRCIFENGTESDMLRRSLSARMYEEEGRRISEPHDKMMRSVKDLTEEDKQTGFVYVLRSLSEKREITSLKHLYKIGFCRGPVEDRVKNAIKEATYLMAPVSIVTAYQCYNFNPHKLESLLHIFSVQHVCRSKLLMAPVNSVFRGNGLLRPWQL
jgi:T5orf172 domain.